MHGEIIEFFIIKQIKKPRLVLCSVVKHLGSDRALKKWGKTLDCVSCFPLHFFPALLLPACFTTEDSTVEARGGGGLPYETDGDARRKL